MSITLVGTPTIADQGSGVNIAIAYPTGHASGHVGYCFVVAPLPGSGATTATGWTQIAASPNIGSGYCALIFRRVLDGTEGSNVTFTTAAGGNCILANMRLYSGVNNTTPEDTAGANPQTAVGTTGQPNVSGFTTLQSGDELIFFATDITADATYGTPSGWGNASLDSASGNAQALGSWDKSQASAGAIGSVTTSGATSGDSWGAILVAMQPAAAILGGWHPQPRRRRLLKPRPFRRYVRQNPREFGGGAFLLFGAVHPLRSYPLRTDKPVVHPYRRPHFVRRVLSFNIVVFYFTAVRHIKRRFQPEVIPRFRRYISQRPRLYSIGAWLVQMPVPLRQRVHKIKRVPYKVRKIWRRVGTLNLIATSLYMAYIARHHKPLPAVKRHPLRATRRASAAAGLLYMLAVRRRNKPLKLPIVIGAKPLPVHRRFWRLGSLASVILFNFAVPRIHKRRPHPGSNPLPPHRYRTMRERYVGFMAAVGGTLDAIVNWRKRKGY